MALNDKDRAMLAHKMDYEGFDYCFRAYSDWAEIKDKKFHKLLAAYRKAAEALDVYIDAESVDLSSYDPEDE